MNGGRLLFFSRCFHRRLALVLIGLSVWSLCGAIQWPAGTSFTWGISNQSLPILSGQIITEARLVFLNVRAASQRLPSDWNLLDRVDLEDWRQFSQCWGKRTDGVRGDMAFFERLSRFWLKSYCGSCGKVDLNADQRVDMTDLWVAVEGWLSEPDPYCAEWDWNANGRIDAYDVAFFSEFWLRSDIIRPSDDRVSQQLVKVYLLTNPRLGFLPATPSGATYFATYGVPVRCIQHQNQLVYVFSLNHDPKSPYALYFGGFVDFSLADGTIAPLSSTLLALITAAGSSGNFGFGFQVGGQSIDFDGVYLELTIQSYTGSPYKRLFYIRAPI